MLRKAGPRSFAVLLLAALALSGAPLFSNSTPGTLDTSFDSDGKATVDFGGADQVYDVVVQPDGKIVAVGVSSDGDFAIARLYGVSGSLDTTFSSDGRYTESLSLASVDVAQAVALQPDGKIVVAGYTNDLGTNDFLVMRLNANGTPDPTFSGDGWLTISFGADDRATAVAVRRDGKIVIAGSSNDGSSNFAVAQLNANGTLDGNFSSDGQVEISFGAVEFANDVAVDAADRVIVVGSYKGGTNTKFALVRLTELGALDTTFNDVATPTGSNGDGRLSLDFVNDAAATDNDEDVATGVRVQPDGKIVVAGYGGSVAGNSSFIVVRLDAGGSYDTSFNNVLSMNDGQGSNIVDLGSGTNLVERTGRVALLHNGKIAVAGSIGTAAARVDMAVLALDRDGTTDATFDVEGELGIDFGGSDSARGMAVHPDGSLIVAGQTTAGATIGNSHNFAIAKVGADPPADTDFSSDGRQTLSFSNSADAARGVVILPDGRVVVAGFSGVADDFVAARYHTTGALDASFSGDGKQAVSFGGSDYAMAVARQADGKLVLVGYTDRNAAGAAAGHNNVAIARLDPDGTLDLTFNDLDSPTASNGDGRLLVDFGFDAAGSAVAIEPNGRIVVAGSANPAGNRDVAVARIRADGTMDTAFSTDGKRTVSMGGADYGQSVAIQTDGKIVIGGYTDQSGADRFAVVRLTSVGAMDTAFSGDGMTTIDLGSNSRAYSVMIQPDGKILLAGSWFAAMEDFAVVRLLANGDLDSTFSDDGRVLATFGVPPAGYTDSGRAIGLLSDGRIVVAGYSDAGSGLGANDFAVLRLTSAGAIDSTFADGGKLLLDFGDTDRAAAVAVDPTTNAVVVAGWTTLGDGDLAIARINPGAAVVPPVLPTLTISNDSGKEGTGGVSAAVFRVALSATPVTPVTVMVSTASGSATQGTDFAGGTLGVTFLPGATDLTHTFGIQLVTDGVDEPNETFTVNLSDASGATIADAQGVGTINDDDITLTFTTPAANPATATQSFVPIAGTAADVGGIQSVTWVNAAGGNGTATGTGTWSAEVPVVKGANVITVTAIDVNCYATSAAVTYDLNELVYYLAEGSTGTFWDLDIAIANPNAVEAPITIRFLKEDTTTEVVSQTLPPLSRTTVRVDDVANMAQTATSTVVTSTAGLPLVVERSMFWDSRYYGSHGGTAVSGPSTRWLFGEGSQGFFDTYVLLANADNAAATATVRFLTEAGAVVTRDIPLPPTSRVNVATGAIPELFNQSFSIVVEATLPIIAERAMYFGTTGDRLWAGGHESVGVTEGATSWLLAEGATGLFDNYVLVGNPNDAPATVTLTYLLKTGQVIQRQKAMVANSRITVNTAAEAPELAQAEFSTRVTADVPVIAERAMYWPAPFPNWTEAHNAFGVTTTALKWGLAEGRIGGEHAFDTYILLANPNTADAQVRITYLRTNGAPIVKEYPVTRESRFTISVNAELPELSGESFAAIIGVLNGQPIAVERALYNNDTTGAWWAAGTNATAVRLP